MSETKSPVVPSSAFDFQFHHLADRFPMMESKDKIELAGDIERNGLREPITLYEDKILDGRNRYEAAKLVGVVFRHAASMA